MNTNYLSEFEQEFEQDAFELDDNEYEDHGQAGAYNGEVTINNDVSEHERTLFREVLADKDAQILASQQKYDSLVGRIADKL